MWQEPLYQNFYTNILLLACLLDSKFSEDVKSRRVTHSTKASRFLNIAHFSRPFCHPLKLKFSSAGGRAANIYQFAIRCGTEENQVKKTPKRTTEHVCLYAPPSQEIDIPKSSKNELDHDLSTPGFAPPIARSLPETVKRQTKTLGLQYRTLHKILSTTSIEIR